MQGQNLLYIAFSVVGLFVVIVVSIVLHQDWRKKHPSHKSH